jgi:hypothetical protein
LGVPIDEETLVTSVLANREMPKSATFTCMSGVNMMFAGLMS